MRYREARTPQHMQTSRGIKAATGILVAALAALGASLSATQVSSNDDLADAPTGVRHAAGRRAAHDALVVVRPAVTDEELDRELQAMKDAGIGGVEVQPVYPVVPDDRGTRARQPAVPLDAVPRRTLAHAAATARSLGLRFDLTLGSGWPYGGPHIPIDHAAGRLRWERVPSPQARRVPLPPMTHRRAADRGDARPDGGAELDRSSASGAVWLPDGADCARPRSGSSSPAAPAMMVKRAAVGAEGYRARSLRSRGAAGAISTRSARRLLDAFGARTPPATLFCDSLEVFGSDWTPDLLPEFERRRGYESAPAPGVALVIRRRRRRPSPSATTGARRSASSTRSAS